MFPGPGGALKSATAVASGVADLVREHCGVPFVLSDVRHLAATMIREDDPNGGAVAQRLLGTRISKLRSTCTDT